MSSTMEAEPWGMLKGWTMLLGARGREWVWGQEISTETQLSTGLVTLLKAVRC